MLVAGEVSGDILGGRLIHALRQRTGGALTVSGVGGERMAAEGLDSLFPMRDLSVMGLVEVLPRLPRLLARIRQTVAHAETVQPDAIVTIDAPSFTLRVLAKLTGSGIPRIHYVAPQHWAWRSGRAHGLRGVVDELLALLPFEPAFFADYDVPCRFVGHPVVESPHADAAAAGALRDSLGIPRDAPLLTLLPGSRLSETSRLMPVFGEALALLAARRPGLRALVVTLPAVRAPVEAAAAEWPVPVVVLAEPDRRFAAFAAADAALAASGTVSLELALARTPTVIAYRTSWLTAAMVRQLVRVDYAALPNLLAGRAVMPEFIQQDCRPGPIADAVATLLDDPAARTAQIEALAEIGRMLGAGGEPPSFRAADAVLEVIQRSKAATKISVTKGN